jgi:2-polyprenyl-3-methyl-5-hydroxy-6-metoxy-1,4-benzoquinol methylase
MGTNQEAWWRDYYHDLYARESKTWLDLSNEAVQAQTFALAIEAAGAIGTRRCLDVGCGHGQLSTCLVGLRAAEVVGVDVVPETIESCRGRFPDVRWECGSPSDETFVRSLGTFDIIFLVEVLQYLDWETTLLSLWESVRAGGRIVGVVPNRDNSIVRSTMSRFKGTYLPPGPSELVALVAKLHAVESWAYRGVDFQADQRLVPYESHPWSVASESSIPANRLVFAIKKEGESPGTSMAVDRG